MPQQKTALTKPQAQQLRNWLWETYSSNNKFIAATITPDGDNHIVKATVNGLPIDLTACPHPGAENIQIIELSA